MNKILEPFSQTKIKPGFLKGFIGEDLVFELIAEYIGRDKRWYGIIKDDTKNESFDSIKALTEAIFVEGSEIIEVEEDDECTAIVYKYEDIVVAFITKMNWTVAVWSE